MTIVQHVWIKAFSSKYVLMMSAWICCDVYQITSYASQNVFTSSWL